LPFVDGVAPGIGRGIVLCMAKEGADIAIADLKIEKAEAVAIEVTALGRKAITVKTDVTKQADFEGCFERVRKELGKIDILVNSFSPSPLQRCDILDMMPQSYDRVLAVNLRGPFFFTQQPDAGGYRFAQSAIVAAFGSGLISRTWLPPNHSRIFGFGLQGVDWSTQHKKRVTRSRGEIRASTACTIGITASDHGKV
jgi:NAD(P)-dependent dehydrogenase (short-subunit alcohol dehydrogenase family)